MLWRNLNDERLAAVTGDSGAILDAAAMAYALGTWPEGDVLRVMGADGRAVWVWASGAGGSSLLCAAVAPWGDVWDVDTVAEYVFFGAVPPDAWVTKARLALVAKDWTSKPARKCVWQEWAVGLFAVAGKPRSRTVRLYRVAKAEGDKLVSVITEDGGPAVPVEAIGAARWIPQDAHPEGYAAMWSRYETESASYMWHVIRAKRAAGLQAGGRAAKAAKQGRAVSQEKD